VFTEPLLSNGLHNPVVPPLLSAGDIENTASSIVACCTVFTELLPGNSLIKSVTVYFLFMKCRKARIFAMAVITGSTQEETKDKLKSENACCPYTRISCPLDGCLSDEG
jgi:hypothetical protein